MFLEYLLNLVIVAVSQKSLKNFRSYLAIFLKKCKFARRFLKQYKNGHFLKSIFWYVLIILKKFLKHPEQQALLDKK